MLLLHPGTGGPRPPSAKPLHYRLPGLAPLSPHGVCGAAGTAAVASSEEAEYISICALDYKNFIIFASGRRLCF